MKIHEILCKEISLFQDLKLPIHPSLVGSKYIKCMNLNGNFFLISLSLHSLKNTKRKECMKKLNNK